MMVVEETASGFMVGSTFMERGMCLHCGGGDGRLLEVIDEQADNPANLNLTPVRVEGVFVSYLQEL
jgi:hypothetical protein